MINNTFQNWTVIGWDKRGERQRTETKKDFTTREQQAGRSITTNLKNTKLNSGGSNGVNTQVMSTRKLEAEQETFRHNTISLNVSKKISQKRCELKLTQKDLAYKLSLPEKIIKDYECGKAIPSHIVLNKIEKILGRVRD